MLANTIKVQKDKVRILHLQNSDKSRCFHTTIQGLKEFRLNSTSIDGIILSLWNFNNYGDNLLSLL